VCRVLSEPGRCVDLTRCVDQVCRVLSEPGR